MSSYYGGGFDEWIEDSFNTTPDKLLAIKAIMWPHRERITTALADFSEDEHSWRTFRNSLWHGYDEEDRQIRDVLSDKVKPTDVLANTVIASIDVGTVQVQVEIDKEFVTKETEMHAFFKPLGPEVQEAFVTALTKMQEPHRVKIIGFVYGDGHLEFEVS